MALFAESRERACRGQRSGKIFRDGLSAHDVVARLIGWRGQMADTADQGCDQPGDGDPEYWGLAEVRVEFARLATPSAAAEGRRIELRARILATRAGLDWRDLVQEVRIPVKVIGHSGRR
jgi:hypothetical protein